MKVLLLAFSIYLSDSTGCKKKENTNSLKPFSNNSNESSEDDPNADSNIGSNAAPSQHLTYSFLSDAVLKMNKIKIVRSANAEYFSVIDYDGGYVGLQQTPDLFLATSNILISSLWDPEDGVGNAEVIYMGSSTKEYSFAGEGTGKKTLNPYKWELNKWYNIVLRAWKHNGKLLVGTFIQNLDTNNWLHTATLTIPDRMVFLGAHSSSFLENWVGDIPQYDGRFKRKAYFKDCWNLTTNYKWEKHIRREFSANDEDQARNGKYDLSFNAGYDPTEDAYFMEHGGTVKRNAGFKNTRKLILPVQRNQGSFPLLTTGGVNDISVTYSDSRITINWQIDPKLSPQLSSKVEIINGLGRVVQSTPEEILPQKRQATLAAKLTAGNYIVKVSIKGIFEQISETQSSFTMR